MFGLAGSQPIAEYEATGEIERVYHEIRQTLRVSGVNLNFRTWAGHRGLLPVLWDAVKANAETMAFEHAADQLRLQASRFASESDRLNAKRQAMLGESQAFQVQGALLLYHYINPKLLLLTSAIRLALQGDSSSGAEQSQTPHERIRLGAHPLMSPMDMEDETPDDERLKAIFGDIKETLSLKSINSDYRTLGLWPDYLDAAWQQLKPHVGTSQYVAAADRLREQSQSLAARLPMPVFLSREIIKNAGADFDTARESSESFEQLLPGLIIQIAMCLHDWKSAEDLQRSPFPAEPISQLRGARCKTRGAI